MNPASQNIAIVPFERIGTGQAVIAGQRQRGFDDRDRIVRDGELDDVGLGRAQQNAIVEIARETVDQASRASMPPTTSCTLGNVASGAPRLDGTRLFRKSISQSRAARAIPS